MQFLPRTFLCLAASIPSLMSFAQTHPAAVGSWQPIKNQPTFNGCVVPLLLTDGSILIQDSSNEFGDGAINTNHWWKFSPDINGSYVNGTWIQVADMDPAYAPLDYASAVLKDGRVIVEGGEYNQMARRNTALGAIYDPVANTWADVNPPAGWTNIGDVPAVVLPDGKFMIPSFANSSVAILDPATMTWTSAATSDEDFYQEEGWTLLPDATVLTIDTANTPLAEKYVISSDLWVPAGETPEAMTNAGDLGFEMGPAVLRFDGSVFAFGANSFTAIYTPPVNPTDPGSWTSGPTLPDNLGLSDAPACLLPTGNILFAASVGNQIEGNPTFFFETDGTTLSPVQGLPGSDSTPCVLYDMLMLPTGQVLVTNGLKDVEIYTPVGNPQDAWRPTISNSPAVVNPGGDYLIEGTQFNGFSQTSFYGDEDQNATNYPLVRVTNTSSGHVFYCRTHDHSTMAVATGSLPVSTHFTVPPTIEAGPSKIEVVANGIASASRDIDVVAASTWSGFLPPFDARKIKAGSTVPLKFKFMGNGTAPSAIGYWSAIVNGSPTTDHEIGMFTYQSSDTYHLDWHTKGLAAGQYQIKVISSDGSVNTTLATLK